MKKLDLVIIEDEGDITNLYKLLFEREGVKVDTILYNGQTAMEKIEESKDELSEKVFLIDNRIPETSGIEVAKRILELNPDLKDQIIIATADEALTRQDVRELGIKYFLRKPFSLDELLRVYNQIIEKRKSEK
ncbi:MAG: response regulator [Candidatus Heimdallarchaeaceae archaeon]|uniref:Response regulator n=1 Tax=Candidatus Heimdallarchaeum endolithica TaxID=2876572 RepID=A0A9Y1BRR9_9ARCH|nr:MAG: response regulator [Candidatus Heimdallarchaeum endolithica]